MNIVKCKKCKNLIEHWCDKVSDSLDEDAPRDCKYFELLTNGDKIRRMTNYELAFALMCPLEYSKYCCTYPNKHDCVNCITAWLESEAKE